jgi:hypothetical protein
VHDRDELANARGATAANVVDAGVELRGRAEVARRVRIAGAQHDLGRIGRLRLGHLARMRVSVGASRDRFTDASAARVENAAG